MLTLRCDDLNEEDTTNTTILMQFLVEGNIKSARKLVNRGADINYINALGQTALHVCVIRYKGESTQRGIEWLFQQKKTMRHVVDAEGMDPCDYAKKLHPELLQKFEEFEKCGSQVNYHHVSDLMMSKTGTSGVKQSSSPGKGPQQS